MLYQHILAFIIIITIIINITYSAVARRTGDTHFMIIALLQLLLIYNEQFLFASSFIPMMQIRYSDNKSIGKNLL
jgi:hypothetical protein